MLNKTSPIKCKLLLIFSYSIIIAYELFLNRSYFFKVFTIGLQINDDKLLIWILSKKYGSPFNKQKYLFIMFMTLCCQGQREYTVLVPKEFWVVREADYRSIKSKITSQKIPNIELRIQSPILNDTWYGRSQFQRGREYLA